MASNSNVKRLGFHNAFIASFYEALFVDLHEHYPLYESWKLDLDYLLLRLQKEGDKFATQSLPLLGKAVEASLITLLTLNVPAGFSKTESSELPLFLQFFFKELFWKDGRPKWDMKSLLQLPLNSRSNLCSLYRAIRQITMAFSKIWAVLEDDKRSKALKEFFARMDEESLSDQYDHFKNSIIREARMLLRRLLPSLGTMCHRYEFWAEYAQNPFGRHGPGAVAGGERGNRKWHFHEVPGFPRDIFSWREGVKPLLRSDTTLSVSRVIDVPKDFRSPRIICIEPKEYQFAQQGLMEILYRTMARDPIIRRHVNMVSVMRQQGLCSDANHATIDLKDASDRISLRLIRLLFQPWAFRLLTTFRSRGMKDGAGKLHHPKCFATMGSALCFPVETLVFWAIAQAAVNLRGYPKDNLHVFGDDIVCSLRNYSVISTALAACGLRINPEKTCTATPIRESCGEYTFGLMPCRITRLQTTEVSTYRHFIAACAYGYDLTCHDYKRAAMAVLLEANRVYPVPFGYYGLPSVPEIVTQARWSKTLHRLEVRLPVLTQKEKMLPVNGYDGLYAWHVHNATRVPSFRGARKRVKVKWVPAWHSMNWAESCPDEKISSLDLLSTKIPCDLAHMVSMCQSSTLWEE
jgi:hypothetical protein